MQPQLPSRFEGRSIGQTVCRQIFPAIASQMVALIYNLADTYFVGLLNLPAQTAAITVVTPVFVMLTAVSNLFGVGGAGAIARALGRQEPDRARQLCAVSFWMGLAAALVFCGGFTLAAEPILRLCGATDQTLPIALDYARWAVIIGGPFTILNSLLANLVRAEGRSGAASLGVSLGGALNIVLDPLFVLPGFLHLEATGAAMATALSNFAATVFFLLYLLRWRKRSVLSLHPRQARLGLAHLGTVLSVGFPSALQYTLTVVSNAALSNFVSHYPTEAVAALGIVKKLDQLPLYFSIGVANGLLPLLAYLAAAGKHPQRRQAFRLGCIISVSFAVFCLVAYELFAPNLSAIFLDDAQTVAYSASFLRRMVTAMPMMAVCYPMIIQFQALGRVKESLVLSLMRKGLLDIPLLFLLDALWPLYGCMWVQPIVDGVSMLAALALYARMQRKSSSAALECQTEITQTNQ